LGIPAFLSFAHAYRGARQQVSAKIKSFRQRPPPMSKIACANGVARMEKMRLSIGVARMTEKRVGRATARRRYKKDALVGQRRGADGRKMLWLTNGVAPLQEKCVGEPTAWRRCFFCLNG